MEAIFYVANLLALCTMHYALCPMLSNLCSLPYAPCPMRYALCSLPYALCSLRHALRALIICKIIVESYTYLGYIYVTQGAELSIRYALCPMRLALQ